MTRLSILLLPFFVDDRTRGGDRFRHSCGRPGRGRHNRAPCCRKRGPGKLCHAGHRQCSRRGAGRGTFWPHHQHLGGRSSITARSAGSPTATPSPGARARRSAAARWTHWEIASALRQAGFHLIESLDEDDHSHFAFRRRSSDERITAPSRDQHELTNWGIVEVRNTSGQAPAICNSNSVVCGRSEPLC